MVGVTVEDQLVLGSVHRKCPTCPSVPAFASASLQRLTCPRQRPFGPGHQARYPASYPAASGEGPGMRPRFPAAFRLPAFASWASCPARGFRPPYGRPTGHPQQRCRTLTGFPRSARVRPGPGRAPSIPRGQRCSRPSPLSAAAACRFSTAGPCHPGNAPRPGVLTMTRHQQEFTGSRPTGPSPHLWPPGWGGGPWAFP